MNTFKMKTQIKYGENALEYLSELENRKILIITDPFMKKCGLLDKILGYLKKSEVKVFDEVIPDPPIEAVVKGVDIAVGYKPEVVVALGGGSAIDEAKAIMYCARRIDKFENTEFTAIPTTSGTGSEVTSFAVITDKSKGIKYPLVSDELLPDTAILASELVLSVPPAVTADTGIDVLTHAIEAYVSTSATDFSDALAEKAVSIVFEYLLRSYKDSNDIEARKKMHNASCIAGIAFNTASLGLNHAISHNISAKLHIPHGRTNAVLLPYVIEFNAKNEYAAAKYAKLAKFCGVSTMNVNTAIRGLVAEIKQLERDLKLPTRVTEEKIDIAVKREIADGAMRDSCILTNPQTAVQRDIIGILDKVMG